MKLFRTTFFLMCILFITHIWAYAQQENPYLPNLWDNRVLSKAEVKIELLAKKWKKEALVEIIGTVKMQLWVLTDAKSQYILFELGHLTEKYLSQAISAAESMHETGSVAQEENENTIPVTTSWSADESVWTESNNGETETGQASYYASSLEWNHTANGDIFDNNAFTAAHKTLPFNTRIKVINTKNNLRVFVRINDRWPFTPGRVIDLSQSAFKALNNDSLSAGILDVTRELIQ